MKKYLVTGGTGFIGSALCHILIKEGNYVRVFDNNFRGRLERLRNVDKEIEFIKGDIRDSKKVTQACKNIDSVVHMAFINGTNYFYTIPETVLDVGVKGIVNIVEGCIKQNVAELILASSSEVYQAPNIIPTPEEVPMIIPDPANPRYSYAAGKIISELMTINFGKKYFKRALIFRPHNVYGPDMGSEHVIPQMILRMKKLGKVKSKLIKFPLQGNGSQTRAFVFIGDFINGIMLILKKGKHLNIYNIGTMDEISIKELAGKIGNLFAKKIEIVPGKPAEGGVLRRCPDIGKLIKLGYNPKITLDEGLKITAEWYKQNS